MFCELAVFLTIVTVARPIRGETIEQFNNREGVRP
jgi:hypothetical protein